MADAAAQLLSGLSLAGGQEASPAQQQQQPQQDQQQEGRPGASRPASHAALQVAGLDSAREALREVVGWPALYAEEGAALGVRWPRGVLLHGPPGCGKTLLVQAVAEEFGASLHSLTAASVFGSYLGESERRLREAFAAARADAERGRIALVFIDEVDALCPRRDGQRQHEARVVAQLLTLLDGADTPGRAGLPPLGPGAGSGAQPVRRRGHVAVVAATNRPNALDPALRRPGRLDREVAVPVPDAAGRAAILRLHASGLSLAPGCDLAAIATGCHGYSGADLSALAREAAMHALTRAAQAAGLLPWGAAGAAAAAGASGSGSSGGAGGAAAAAAAAAAGGGGGEVTAEDFLAAMKRVGPSIVRGAEVEAPPVRWEDVGGLAHVKQRLRQAVEWPLLHRAAFDRLGISAPRGVLLYGPPGCSKTTLARAAAYGSKATLLPLSCAQLFSSHVGEGEELLRDVFRRARMAAPAIVLLDEVDAIAPRRAEGEGAREGGSDAGVRLLSTLLTEMDGMELATGVLVLAATNRPAAVDAALLRPGRLDVKLYVPPPDEEGRLQVLQIHSRRMPLAADVDLLSLARDAHGFTGAELASLCREAALAALREDLESAREVAARHFAAARAAKRPALGAADLLEYEHWGGSGAGGGAAAGLTPSWLPSGAGVPSFTMGA